MGVQSLINNLDNVGSQLNRLFRINEPSLIPNSVLGIKENTWAISEDGHLHLLDSQNVSTNPALAALLRKPIVGLYEAQGFSAVLLQSTIDLMPIMVILHTRRRCY